MRGKVGGGIVAAGKHRLLIEQGATWSRTVVWKDAAGLPIDLTGYSARMQIRSTRQGGTALVSLTSSPAGGITITPAEGKIVLRVEAAETTTLTPGTAFYDLEVVSGAGEVTRLLEGGVTISPEVTV